MRDRNGCLDGNSNPGDCDKERAIELPLLLSDAGRTNAGIGDKCTVYSDDTAPNDDQG